VCIFSRNKPKKLHSTPHGVLSMHLFFKSKILHLPVLCGCSCSRDFSEVYCCFWEKRLPRRTPTSWENWKMLRAHTHAYIYIYIYINRDTYISIEESSDGVLCTGMIAAMILPYFKLRKQGLLPCDPCDLLCNSEIPSFCVYRNYANCAWGLQLLRN